LIPKRCCRCIRTGMLTTLDNSSTSSTFNEFPKISMMRSSRSKPHSFGGSSPIRQPTLRPGETSGTSRPSSVTGSIIEPIHQPGGVWKCDRLFDEFQRLLGERLGFEVALGPSIRI
jgi:hypothetical protein